MIKKSAIYNVYVLLKIQLIISLSVLNIIPQEAHPQLRQYYFSFQKCYFAGINKCSFII